MRRLTQSLCLALATVSASPALAQTSPFAGVWLFDDAPDYPGVTMMQIEQRGSALTGVVTSEWYGPMAMQDVRVEGDTIRFMMRNLNDRSRATREWTAARSGNTVHLTGHIWSTDAEQDGRRGTAADAAQRTFRVMPLPPEQPLSPDGLAQTPPMGWSSWNKFAEHIDDATVRAMADALVSTGLRDAGYIYVNIDDGWQGERAPDGTIQPNDKFPDMKALADYVHARGLKLGIYSSQGPKTCAGYEGSYGHVQQDAQTFADWGIDYLKYDLCSGEWFYDTRDTVIRSYQEMARAVRATGRPMLFSICEYGRFDVGSWGRAAGGHLWRTTGDITDEWQVMANIGFDHNGNPANTGPGGWNDPDMLEIGNGGMNHDEYQTHMTLWAISAAPLILGHDLRETTPEQLALLTNRDVLAIDQDAKGVQGTAVRKADGVEIWRKPLADGSVAIAIFNRNDAAVTADLLPADIGLGTVRQMRDLWSGDTLAPDATKFNLPAHGSVLLRIS